MLEHYSHVRLETKRQALDALSGRPTKASEKEGYGTKDATTNENQGLSDVVSYSKDWSGREDLNLRPPGPEPGALPG